MSSTGESYKLPIKCCKNSLGKILAVCRCRPVLAEILREGRQAVVTFIDYSAAFDTDNDNALAETVVSSKVRRIVQAIFAAATGVVRIRQQDGGVEMSEPFNIERGVLQGDIFSPVCFIAELDRIFKQYNTIK